ncbi:hypothetical protein [Kocuria rhizosphaericola]|uniref:hypothetical protein n=1 Tax=Kocuria rhizosphaericola TaxID=3376284 RepID=UPI0037A020C0
MLRSQLWSSRGLDRRHDEQQDGTLLAERPQTNCGDGAHLNRKGGAMASSSTSASTSLFKGGPTLLDLLIDVSELKIAVTGPRMLFEKLTLVTTLSAFDGCTVGRTRKLADSLEGTIHCGLIGVQRADITVQSVRSGGHLEIGLGPPSLYQSELVLRTRTGETFRELLSRLLATDSSAPFIAGLYPVTATGHLERHLGPDPDSGNGGGHGHGHGSGHEHGGGHHDGRP